MKRRIPLISSNPAVSPVTGWPIGFLWAELTHAYEVFRAAGYEVVDGSPDGGDRQQATAIGAPRRPAGDGIYARGSAAVTQTGPTTLQP